jgi:hypothetical protein
MKRGYLIALIVLAVLTLVSLALNGVTILWSLYTRQITLAALSGARTTVAAIGDETLSYTFEISQGIPITASVPISKSVVVPIRATIPVSTVVIIPVNAGILGTFDLDVPIRTIIPVNLDVTVPLSETVEIATTVPVNLDVPIRIPIAKTPLAGYLENLDAALGQVEDRLENPLGNARE